MTQDEIGSAQGEADGSSRLEEQIHVSLAADAGFERPLSVTMASLAAAHRSGECRITVLHRDLDPSFRRDMQGLLEGRVAVEWVPLDERLLGGAAYAAFASAASNYRLLLPTVLPPEHERTIYLDADTIVLDSLRALWDVDLGDHLLGAVRDAASPWPAGPSGTDWQDLGLSAGSCYFNAGVMLVPLAAWRAEGTAETALTVLRRSAPRWGDQDALNAAVEGRWCEVPRRWNVQTADVERRGIAWALWPDDVRSAVDRPGVVHLTEGDKPWLPRSSHPWAETWFQYLEQTPFAGWRPGAHRAHPYRRAASRVRRAGRVLVHGS